MMMELDDQSRIDLVKYRIARSRETLKEAELVECLNEEDKRYRFYSITDKGKYYLDKVEKNYKD